LLVVRRPSLARVTQPFDKPFQRNPSDRRERSAERSAELTPKPHVEASGERSGQAPSLHSREPVRGIDEPIHNPRLSDGVARVGDHVQLGLGPGPVQVPGAGQGADDVVAPLDDDPRDMADFSYVPQELVLLQEGMVDKVMAFNAGEGQAELVLPEPSGQALVKEELTG